jgi:hypothetical protein
MGTGATRPTVPVRRSGTGFGANGPSVLPVTATTDGACRAARTSRHSGD